MAKKGHKYIFVIGGVMSGVGKGVVVSSIGNILQARGISVTAVKIDQYFNVDAGTMNPTEHGEVFVTIDGDETDQDIGNYERFLNRDITSINYMTSGRVYLSVIERERNLGYKGKCVEAIPHVSNEIIRRIEKAAHDSKSEITIVEIGGTTGEYQNLIYLEAARVMHQKNPDDVQFILVSYLPVPPTVGEMKSKPTQQASSLLNSAGIQADFIVARAEKPVDQRRKEKLSMFCNVPAENVISAPDIKSIYDVPLNFEKEEFAQKILKTFGVKGKNKANLKEWEKFAKKAHNGSKTVKIAVVGKYFNTGDFVLSDAYLSVIEAIKFSGYALGVKPELDWLSSVDFETGKKKLADLKKYDGVLIPGGFGTTGIEGKIKAIKYIRENKIPYFGLCYGMQLAVVEYARNVLGLKEATTHEIDKDGEHLVIDIMEEQKEKLRNKEYGGTMRLGTYKCDLKKGTIARKAYGEESVDERHRHRYEVNPKYIDELEKAGLVFSGTSPNKKLMEIAELPKKKHPFFLATQFHPELQARPLSPHPLFTEFVKACLKK